MDRLQEVRGAIDEIVHQQTNVRYRHGAYIHLYGVSANCALLALKRGLDVQVAQVAGMLHDLSTYQAPMEPTTIGSARRQRAACWTRWACSRSRRQM